MLGKLLTVPLLAIATVGELRCDSARTCIGYEPLLAQYAPEAGWHVQRMSSIMYRESRCDADAYNAGGKAVGLLQITPVSYEYLAQALGTPINAYTLTDPVTNIRAGAALFDYWVQAGRSGYQPWRM